MMWLILKMFEMFISQGQSGSHLKKLGWGLPDSGRSVSSSRCCASHFCSTSSGWGLQNNCRFPWSVQWCASCGYSWLWFGCCGCNLCSGWGCWCRSHWEHPRWGLWCSWGYICADRCVWLHSIWMTFTDVVTCMSVLASANDSNQVWVMSGLIDDCGWEPEGLGVIEDRDSLPCIQWGLWSAVMIIVYSILGGMVIEVICQLQLGGPCAWSFGAQWFLLLSGRAFQLVNEGVHWWVCSCMPTRQGRGPALNTWHGEETFCNLDSSFSLAITPWVPRWTCGMIKVPLLGELSELMAGKLWSIIRSDGFRNSMLGEQLLEHWDGFSSITLWWWYLPDEWHLGVVVDDD